MSDFTQNIDSPLTLPPDPSFAPADILEPEFVPSHMREAADPHPGYQIAIQLLGWSDGLGVRHDLEKTSVYKNERRVQTERQEYKMKKAHR
jgi:hypothetical protein